MSLSQKIRNHLEKMRIIGGEDKKLIFTISSTAGFHPEDFFTPIRTFGDYTLSGLVVRVTENLKLICEILDGEVDLILADAEKKIKITAKEIDDNTHIDTGNLYKLSKSCITKTAIFPFKANDLTVEAVMLEAFDIFGDLSGLKVCIIGLGNIGSKIAIKLNELGAELNLYSRDFYKTTLVQNYIENIKNVGVLSGVKVFRNIESALFNSDFVILCANSKGVLDADSVKLIRSKATILDVGKENLTQSAVEISLKRGIGLIRLDYSITLLGYVNMITSVKENFRTKRGRKIISDFSIVSGGIIGYEGDVIVDDFDEPQSILGLCDGSGGIIYIDDQAKTKIWKQINGS